MTKANNTQSAAEMMNINNKDTNAEDADFGNNMPETMTPNDKASFPAVDGSEPKKPTTKSPNKPTPVRDGEEDEAQQADEKVSKATPSPTASAKPKASSSAASTETEDEVAEEEERGSKKPAAEAAAEATPAAAAEKPAPKPKDDNMLSKVPLIGGLLGGASPLGGL
jgi:hypothetical protein